MCKNCRERNITEVDNTNERPQRARIPEDRRNDGPSPRGAASRGNTIVFILAIRVKGRSGPAFPKIGEMMVHLPAGRPVVVDRSVVVV